MADRCDQSQRGVPHAPHEWNVRYNGGGHVGQCDGQPATSRTADGPRITDAQLFEWAQAAVDGPAGAEAAHVVLLAGEFRRLRDNPLFALLADEDRAVELIATTIAHDNGRAGWQARDWSNASAVLAALREVAGL